MTILILFALFGLLLFIVHKSSTGEELHLLRSRTDEELHLLRSRTDEELHLLRSRTDEELHLLRKNLEMLNHWHSYGFCLLSNGQCPPGFTKQQNWMKAVRMYSVDPFDGQVRLQGNFGDSVMKRHRLGDDTHADLILSTCCKTFDKQS